MQDFLETQNAAKSGRIQNFAKTLWPQVAGASPHIDNKKAKAFILKCFAEAKSRQEFNRIDSQKDVEALIRAEQSNFKVTQKQIMKVISQMYENARVKDSFVPQTVMTAPKIPTKPEVDLRDLPDESNVVEARGDYSDYYRRI